MLKVSQKKLKMQVCSVKLAQRVTTRYSELMGLSCMSSLRRMPARHGEIIGPGLNQLATASFISQENPARHELRRQLAVASSYRIYPVLRKIKF
ncbi:hypothetical protein QL285_045437 [Trifolium repens]|nr:hypothetical protein QL285_045437 [Trifolium repens]